MFSHTFKNNGFYKYYEMELPPLIDYIEYGTYYYKDTAFYLKPLLPFGERNEGHRPYFTKEPYYKLDKNFIPLCGDTGSRWVYDSTTNALTNTNLGYCGSVIKISNPADTLLFK